MYDQNKISQLIITVRGILMHLIFVKIFDGSVFVDVLSICHSLLKGWVFKILLQKVNIRISLNKNVLDIYSRNTGHWYLMKA